MNYSFFVNLSFTPFIQNNSFDYLKRCFACVEEFEFHCLLVFVVMGDYAAFLFGIVWFFVPEPDYKDVGFFVVFIFHIIHVNGIIEKTAVPSNAKWLN